MDVYLQRTDNRHYFRRTGEWVTDCRQAREFGSSIAALECARASSLNGVQIILRFEALEYDVALPIRETLLKGRTKTDLSECSLAEDTRRGRLG